MTIVLKNIIVGRMGNAEIHPVTVVLNKFIFIASCSYCTKSKWGTSAIDKSQLYEYTLSIAGCTK